MYMHASIWEKGFISHVVGSSIESCDFREGEQQYEEWCNGYHSHTANKNQSVLSFAEVLKEAKPYRFTVILTGHQGGEIEVIETDGRDLQDTILHVDKSDNLTKDMSKKLHKKFTRSDLLYALAKVNPQIESFGYNNHTCVVAVPDESHSIAKLILNS